MKLMHCALYLLVLISQSYSRRDRYQIFKFTLTTQTYPVQQKWTAKCPNCSAIYLRIFKAKFPGNCNKMELIIYAGKGKDMPVRARACSQEQLRGPEIRTMKKGDILAVELHVKENLSADEYPFSGEILFEKDTTFPDDDCKHGLCREVVGEILSNSDLGDPPIQQSEPQESVASQTHFLSPECPDEVCFQPKIFHTADDDEVFKESDTVDTPEAQTDLLMAESFPELTSNMSTKLTPGPRAIDPIYGQSVNREPGRPQNGGILPGKPVCRESYNASQHLIYSPLFPEFSRGGDCSKLLMNYIPRSSKIKFEDLQLAEGDFLAFEDVTGTFRFNGPSNSIKTFGLIWPFRFLFSTANQYTNSKFRLNIEHTKQPFPCHEIVHIDKGGYTLNNPAGKNGRMPRGLFCEIRISVERGSRVRFQFTQLDIGLGEVVQIQTSGPELTPAGKVFRVSTYTKNKFPKYHSVENTMSIYIITQANSVPGHFIFTVSKV